MFFFFFYSTTPCFTGRNDQDLHTTSSQQKEPTLRMYTPLAPFTLKTLTETTPPAAVIGIRSWSITREEHFDPRYHEDPREFRDYRDPFEQDIRKYTYIQRERERERERFEADRGRWSPSHPRRPITPSASPSPSERAPRDPERRVYSQSSERSGSCSSLSPPRFDKADKAPPLEHGASSKIDRLEKDAHPVEPERERGAGAEKSKRGRRKEKGDKEKGEKSKSRKGKVQSPSIPPSETELEPSLDGGSGRGKVSDQDSLERQIYKGDNDPPPSDPTASTSRHEPVKSERLESGKGEIADKDVKTRSKKHQKSDTGNDGKDPSLDSDRLAARKRRFGDASGRTIRQKRRRLEDGSQPPDFGASTAFSKEKDGDDKAQQKDSQRRDSRSKMERLVFLGSQDPVIRGQEELPEGSMDPIDSKHHSMSRRFSNDGSMDHDNTRDQDPLSPFKYGAQDNDKGVKEEPLDIDLSQSYRKQMEQRRLHQQLQEPDKQEKPGSPQGLEREDLEHRSLVHEVGKPPQDVTDNFPSHKLKKLEQFDADISAKRGDRVYRSFRQKSEDPEWNNTASPGLQHFSHHAEDPEWNNTASPGLQHFSHHAEEDFAESSHLREVKTEDKSHPDLELAVKRTHTMQMSKPNTPLQISEEEREKRWESRVKQDFLPDLNFSRVIGKNPHHRKRLEYGILNDLEPGEVRSDSEEDREDKPHSPMPSTSGPLSDRQSVDRFSDPKLATLERMKFYSFALDQTITPDTKALLERAKSLSSSREDNWSFLDYDSHFAGLRSRKDTEKVESAPRPTPSWYMKKKKIRSSGSEDKLDDRKEEPKPKPEEHERRELFASRFLHSSIFEQDSRRLQHLERKHEDHEQSPGQQTGQQGPADGQPDTEPVVLFHSRFLEFTRLQQQKDQPLPDVKKADSIDENRVEKSPEAEQQPLQLPKTSEPVMDPEIKPISLAEDIISQPPLMPKEMSRPKQMSPLLLPPKQMSPPLPPKEMSPPKQMFPPLPPKEMSPPKQTSPPKQISPLLPPKEMSPPVETHVMFTPSLEPEAPEPAAIEPLTKEENIENEQRPPLPQIYGRVESVKVLRKRGSEGGVAAFVDFVDIKSAQKAHNAVNKMGDRDLRTDYNEPGSVPSAVRGLDDNPPSSSHGRDVSGFSRGAVGPVFGPPVSLHTREGRYERIRDGSESRERAYDHSPYGHHERGGTFDRQRHYNADYYRDRTMFAAGVSPGPGSGGAMGGSFETPEPHFESRIRGDPFTLSSAVRRDPYRDDRGRRVDRTYHRRSRSSHSSQSRHPSPQRTTGQTPKAPHSPKRAPLSPGRGPRSRSRSRSSSSDSVSSTSSTGSGSDSNSSSSDGSHARSVQSSATHAPPSQPCSMVMEGDEPRRSFGIRVQNLPVRSTGEYQVPLPSNTSLKDGLFHEFKKHGKVTSVQIHGALEDRYGLVFFRQQEDQEKALNVSKGKLFFGMMIEVSAWNGPETESENEFRPLDGRIDEFHPKATRTLFIGNLEKTTSYQQLLDIFQRFGEIVLGFGKSMPTTCVWLDGLASNITEQYLTRHFCRYGHVVKVVFDRLKGMSLILYNNTDFAQAAVRETKGWKIGGNKIKVDFASQESQMAFYRAMQASGQDIRDFYEIPTERREERPRPPYHEFSAERAYFENARTPGTIYPEDPRRDYPARSRERYSELEHYQGEHFDPRYHEDPREFRDYRDPFEQDIRKYTYIQRERERERERFEADRGMWSPSHPRRPITPSASPSPSERAPRDPERRVYSQSSERSGSCSSLSPPPRFDKTDKAPPLEHGASSKSERLEKDTHLVEPERERGAGAEKSKRGRRKEKGDKEKGEKSKSRKGKVQSPSIPPSETELEPSLDGGSGRGKVSDQDSLDRQRYKGDDDPPPSDPTTSTSRHEPVKSERLESGKGENADKDGKTRSKKHQKSDTGNDGKDPSVDSDRLAARKRRFGDASGRTIRQKRRRLETEEGSQAPDFGASTAFPKATDGDSKAQQKDSQRRDSRSKTERLAFLGSHKEGQDPVMRGQEELPEGSVDPMDSKRHPSHSMSRRFSHDGNMDQDNARDQDPPSPFKYGAQDNDKGVKEEPLDIDLSQSYRKQMEQRRLHQQLQEPDKQEKPGSPQGLETEDLEHRSLVHEVGKPPQDVTDNFPSHKLKKLEQFDADMSAKRGDRVYRSFRQKSEDPEWHNTASPGLQHFSHHAEEDFAESSHLREVKTEDKSHPDLELAVKRTHTTQMSKPSTPLQLSEEEREKRWESRVKQDFLPDLNFSRGIGKNTHNRKRLECGILHDLEPGEVRSDSEEDREHKPHSPMPSTSMPFSDRQRVDRFSDPKLATLERMKFYSFALDQTITPDTKALLERAKSLSSSREDNWSFLDYDSHFTGLRSRKDTEKVESAPRPTGSWYQRKKKIRSGGSEDKLDDRKEESKPKPEEHERRELFASRFLHSSIFEQDSRRLQHLERKHEDPEQSQAQQTGQQGLADGQPDTEPVVLFHSRFLEFTRLQQQKDQQLHEVKRADSIDGNRVEKSPEAEPQPLQLPKTSEPVMDPETKPISPAENHMISQPPLMPKEMSPPKQMYPPLPPKGMSPPKQMSPPLPLKEMSPPKQISPPLPPKEMSPPLPPKEMSPPKQMSPPLPPKEMSPPLPPKEMSPPKQMSPPLPPKEMSPPKQMSPPLPPKEMSPPKQMSPPLPPKEMSPPKQMSPPLPPKEMSPTVETRDMFTPEPEGPEPAAQEPFTKENRENEQLPPLLQISPHEMSPAASVNLVAPEPIRSVRKVKKSPSEEKFEEISQNIKMLNPEQSSSGDCLHETSVSSSVPEPELAPPELPPELLSSTPPNPVEEMEVSKDDTNTDDTEVEKKLDLNQTQVLVDNETSDESISSPQKSKNKKIVEEQPVLEKVEKSGRGKAPRLTRTPKSPVLKNLKIRLNVTESHPTPLAQPSAELKIETEEDKPANPASEYELAAAIDSIMGEDIPVPLPQEPVISAVVDSDPEIPTFVQPTKGAEPATNTSPIQGESFFPTTPRKGAKGRAKTPKRSKSQKSNKKDAVKEITSEPESTSVITSDRIPSNAQPVLDSIPSTTAAGVITATSWKPKTEHLVPKAIDMPKESKLPPVLADQPPPQHLKPVCPPTKSPILPKPQKQQQPPPPPPECISPSLSPPPTRPNIRPTQLSRIPVSPPDWLNQSKDAGVPSSPRASAAPFENPAIPPDTEPMETEHNISDLRRILMKHKNVSLPVPCSSSVPTNLGTSSLRDPPHPPDSNTPMVAVPSKAPLNDNRLPSHPAQPVVRPPASLPSPESKSVISVIASAATSVISRVCNPPDMDKVNMSVDRNPCVDMPLPKQAYRPPSMEDRDSGSYHGPSVGEEGGSAGRYLVESSGLGTGSIPGLRVNTSEGVVVLSHSGQIKEGPQRISAKISQIPPATVVDMESQQLVSMPQIKPEIYTHPKWPQGGVVKRLQQTVGSPQVMGYHHPEFTMLLKHPKKVDGADAMTADGGKPSWTSAISPAMSPHLPSPAGNHVGFVSGSATDRTPSHLSGVKQEPRSPRKSGHPHSPFTKVSSPIGGSSPKGLPGMLPSGLPAMQQYVTSVHHPEQSVIMQPHSAHVGIGRMSPHRVSQVIPMGHLVQGEVRVNTPPLSVMSFGMHGDPVASPWSGPLQQRPTSPQAVGRDMVLKVNPGNVRGHEGEQEDARRFHQATGRPSATQLKPETMQADPRGALLSGLQLDPYMSPRDMRVLMHHPQGERSAPEPHQGHIQETGPPSSTSTNITSSMSPRAHLLSKGVSEKDAKPQEVKRPHSPLKDGMMGIRPSMATMASPQRVQLLPSGTGASFSEYPGMYSNTRAIHSQITETSPFAINQAPLNITSTLGADPSQSQADGKVKQVGHQPVNMVQLLTKYPIVWQGLLALKNDQAAVQLHFVCGNKALALRSLPLPEGGALLRIVQRMRLEASQLDGVARRMTGESEFCLLLALPCGRDQEDVLNQTQALRTAFINYLQAKLAAGIINVPNPGSNQPAYVLQIFPPCEFSESHLSRLAPDLLNRISNISPHLMIVITSV
ncbi:unnamed protein product [Coregonus sp. 'balchen']|nr:unnamed protein product [Coregonus sp. 'balchen']